MSIAARVREFMDFHGFEYDVLRHPRSRCSEESAHLAHVPVDQVAKSVLLEDDSGFFMAVVPANHRVKLGEMGRLMDRKLRLAMESELTALFDDCAPGAIPPLGLAYGIDTIVDDALVEMDDIYFEAGDHERLIHMRREAFARMMDLVGQTHFVDAPEARPRRMQMTRH